MLFPLFKEEMDLSSAWLERIDTLLATMVVIFFLIAANFFGTISRIGCDESAKTKYQMTYGVAQKVGGLIGLIGWLAIGYAYIHLADGLENQNKAATVVGFTIFGSGILLFDRFVAYLKKRR
jgi:hypothetical protein